METKPQFVRRQWVEDDWMQYVIVTDTENNVAGQGNIEVAYTSEESQLRAATENAIHDAIDYLQKQIKDWQELLVKVRNGSAEMGEE